ncbi:MAG: hypothetical protein ACREJ2_04345 [Planctomycetota bacterium]
MKCFLALVFLWLATVLTPVLAGAENGVSAQLQVVPAEIPVDGAVLVQIRITNSGKDKIGLFKRIRPVKHCGF